MSRSPSPRGKANASQILWLNRESSEMGNLSDFVLHAGIWVIVTGLFAGVVYGGKRLVDKLFEIQERDFPEF